MCNIEYEWEEGARIRINEIVEDGKEKGWEILFWHATRAEEKVEIPSEPEDWNRICDRWMTLRFSFISPHSRKKKLSSYYNVFFGEFQFCARVRNFFRIFADLSKSKIRYTWKGLNSYHVHWHTSFVLDSCLRLTLLHKRMYEEKWNNDLL